jgi:hypothetical protein
MNKINIILDSVGVGSYICLDIGFEDISSNWGTSKLLIKNEMYFPLKYNYMILSVYRLKL